MTDQSQSTEIQSLWNNVRDFAMQKSILSADIIKLEQELYKTEFYQWILAKKAELRELEKTEQEAKDNIVKQMLKYDLKSIEFTHQKFTLKRTPGSIVIQDEKVVPAEYKKEKTEIVIDKKALKEAVANWLVLDGVEITYSQSLLITPRS